MKTTVHKTILLLTTLASSYKFIQTNAEHFMHLSHTNMNMTHVQGHPVYTFITQQILKHYKLFNFLLRWHSDVFPWVGADAHTSLHHLTGWYELCIAESSLLLFTLHTLYSLCLICSCHPVCPISYCAGLHIKIVSLLYNKLTWYSQWKVVSTVSGSSLIAGNTPIHSIIFSWYIL